MIYRISDIKLKTGEPKEHIAGKIAKKLGRKLGGAHVENCRIVRESLDARNKSDIRFVYTVDFETVPFVKLDLPEGGEEEYVLPGCGDRKLNGRVVVCGFGPCGMFAALLLAQAGCRPLVIERGKAVDERVADVERFRADGILDAESNVQFGEGGAGTFSDGKLTTGIRDTRIRKVLREFVNAGADENILYRQKPHIGTDRLRVIVKNMRLEIEKLGGEICFSSRLDGIDTVDGKLTGIYVVRGGERIRIASEALILATGHSARDTVRMLAASGLEMTQKPFSVGARIEHLQELIDRAQYGDTHEALGLPPAEYKLSYRASSGRGVYTFCMCPGGEIITASSESGGVVTNGMSDSARSGKYANSAVLVDVRTDDFGSDNPLAGIAFQEKYECAAFVNGGGTYRPPKATLAEFETGSGAGIAVRSSMPDFAVDAMLEALPYFGRKLKGFDSPEATLTAVETRSSSPVRIVRDSGFESTVRGIYPAGEGAGYAGGIVSAACDGIRIAEKIISTYNVGEEIED